MCECLKVGCRTKFKIILIQITMGVVHSTPCVFIWSVRVYLICSINRNQLGCICPLSTQRTIVFCILSSLCWDLPFVCKWNSAPWCLISNDTVSKLINVPRYLLFTKYTQINREQATSKTPSWKYVIQYSKNIYTNIFKITISPRTHNPPYQETIAGVWIYHDDVIKVSFDLRLNKRLNKQPWGRWFETPSGSLRRQCNDIINLCFFVTYHCQRRDPRG